ncbi:MAG: redoxin domain-containing protein [Streptosporangiales bacterium]|nr:redoxin domain-containing protein [Streptosporangiales bacterium]
MPRIARTRVTTLRRSTIPGRPRTLVIALVSVLLATTGCASAGGATASDGENQRYIAGTGRVDAVSRGQRQQAPVLRGETLDGDRLSTADFRGKVGVVNWWASWCPPCRAEAPALQAVYAKTKADGVQFVGVNFKDNRTNAKLFEREFKITYPSIYDQPGAMALAFRGQLPPAAVPSTIVIDRKGRVAARIIGQTNYTSLLGVVRKVANE